MNLKKFLVACGEVVGGVVKSVKQKAMTAVAIGGTALAVATQKAEAVYADPAWVTGYSDELTGGLGSAITHQGAILLAGAGLIIGGIIFGVLRRNAKRAANG